MLYSMLLFLNLSAYPLIEFSAFLQLSLMTFLWLVVVAVLSIFTFLTPTEQQVANNTVRLRDKKKGVMDKASSFSLLF